MINKIFDFSLNNSDLVIPLMLTFVVYLLFNKMTSSKIISNMELVSIINKKNNQTVLLDIRSAKEFKNGHITKSINYPNSNDRKWEEILKPNKTKDIIVICDNGISSKSLANKLKEKDFNTIVLDGGINMWKTEYPLLK